MPLAPAQAGSADGDGCARQLPAVWQNGSLTADAILTGLARLNPDAQVSPKIPVWLPISWIDGAQSAAKFSDKLSLSTTPHAEFTTVKTNDRAPPLWSRP